MTSDFFRVCSTCRTPIAYGADYYKCSVSTCNRKKLAMFFCTVECWDAHVPGAGHRDAWAEKETAPSREQAEASESASRASESASRSPSGEERRRRVVGVQREATPSVDAADGPELSPADTRDVLVVVSKMKKYIKDRSGMNTSGNTADALSDHLRAVADQAVREAAKDERKTVMDRDVVAALRRMMRSAGGE